MGSPYDRIAGLPIPGANDLWLPAPLVSASVSKVSQHLLQARTVSAWLESSLLVPDTGNRVARNQLDEAIEKQLPYLTNVCHQPLDRLGVVRELVPAQRARRVPVSGLLRLASHREDWWGIEEGRIHPRRLLALTFVEDLDFHENRVAAQLVDRLSRYLAARLRELRSLKAHIEELADLQRALHGDQNFRKRERLAYLLASIARAAQDQSAVVDQTLGRLGSVRGRLAALRGSSVYRAVNRRSRLPVRLRRTNLLSNDGNYHHVADLWDAWARNEVAARDANREAAYGFAENYDTYVAAATLHALADLGWRPVAPAVPAPVDGGAAITLTANGGSCSLDLRIDSGVIHLVGDGKTTARVVPLADALTHDRSPSEVNQCVGRIFEAAAGSTVATIIVYPGERNERLDARLPTAVHACVPLLLPQGGPRLLAGIVPVTPLDIEGIERLARALRWVVHGYPMVNQYPPALPPALVPRSASPSWLTTDGAAWRITRRPTPIERRTHLEQLAAAMPYQPPGRSRRQRPIISNSIEDMNRQMDGCLRIFDLLEYCLVCGRAQAQFDPQDPATFQSWCECGAHWGTRFCQGCDQRFPVLWPSGVRYTGDPGDQLDAAFGRDLLAFPCATSPDGSRFRCPWCATCQGAPSCGCEPPKDIDDGRRSRSPHFDRHSSRMSGQRGRA